MASTKKVSDYQYLIVGGTTKAATTSLFTYLADHPAVCAASYKETRFFLDKRYPLPSKYRYDADVEVYNLLFSECAENQLRLESTPDYLYCLSACERIAMLLPKAKLVFSLREPISRLFSWYRFAKQIGKLPQSIDFDDYVDLQFNIATSECPKKTIDPQDANHVENITHEQHLQTLQQGCYAPYLKQYLERFGKERIHTLFYEDLSTQPSNVLEDVCHFASINGDFYKNYEFKVTNRTETMRNAEIHQKYRSFRFQVRQWTHNRPLIHRFLRGMRRAIEPLYLRLNTRPNESVSISEKTQRRLIDYYKHDVLILTELIGRQPPWEAFI